MTTTMVVFGLLAGWLAGYGVLRLHIGMGLRGAYIVAPRLVSWACFLALAGCGPWRFAAGGTR